MAAVHGGGAGMAGGAIHLAHIAHAAVDGGDHAQGQVQFVEHRALLDVHFDEAQVVRGIAPDLGDVVDAQAGVLHGLAHGDAVGILLLQPLGLEVADQRARAQEGGLVALAFLLGKAHHLNTEGQALAGTVQFAHAGHGHEDAQAAVVLAAVAHGVVVAAGQQVLGASLGRVVAADHVAHGVDLDLVKAAVAHPVADALGAGAVGVGQVGDGELALLGIARFAVLGQLFLPVPDIVAQRGGVAELVVEANLCNAMDVAQSFGPLVVRVVEAAARKGVDDFGLAQPSATRAAHGQDEGEAEARVVVGVELLDAREFLGRAGRQASGVLFVGGFSGQRLGHHGLAGQLRVGADQAQLRLGRGLGQHLDHGVLEVGQRLERALCQRGFGNPGRMLVQAVQQLHGAGGVGGVELFQGQGHGASCQKIELLTQDG